MLLSFVQAPIVAKTYCAPSSLASLAGPLYIFEDIGLGIFHGPAASARGNVLQLCPGHIARCDLNEVKMTSGQKGCMASGR